ncbi:MAG: hypothetical protein V3V64_00040 [Acidiferrobacterales bacterium]
MASLDHVRLAHALAKAFVQPGVSDDTIEQCIYQIGLAFANDDPNFDLRGWRLLLAKHHASLKRSSRVTKVAKARLAKPAGRRETASRHGKEADHDGKARRA